MTEDKFKFLGALIVNLKRRPSLKRGRSIPLGIKAPIGALIGKLKTTGFLRQNHQEEFYPKHLAASVNLSHNDILSFYNSKILGILNFYSKASNLNKLGNSRVI